MKTIACRNKRAKNKRNLTNWRRNGGFMGVRKETIENETISERGKTNGQSFPKRPERGSSTFLADLMSRYTLQRWSLFAAVLVPVRRYK